MADGQARTEGGAMADTHEHKCSQCGTAWQHGDESNEQFREHICPSCGYLELMVFKSDAPPMGAADYPRAVANFLKALTGSDESARAAAACSLGYLQAEPDRAIPALTLAAIGDGDASVRQAAADGLRRFGPEKCEEAAGCLWSAIAAIFEGRKTPR
jgi:predicted  nucleic acid-binding Zn-ribbon protein